MVMNDARGPMGFSSNSDWQRFISLHRAWVSRLNRWLGFVSKFFSSSVYCRTAASSSSSFCFSLQRKCLFWVHVKLASYIFELLGRDLRSDIVARRPGYSWGQNRFLPVAIEGVIFYIGLFLQEKGAFGFLGSLSPSKSQKSKKGPFFRKKANC